VIETTFSSRKKRSNPKKEEVIAFNCRVDLSANPSTFSAMAEFLDATRTFELAKLNNPDEDDIGR
jgi:hypothetical protein